MSSKIMQYIYLNIFLLPETAHTEITAKIVVKAEVAQILLPIVPKLQPAKK